MSHNIPTHLVEEHHKAPEQTMIDSAVQLHTNLRDILGGNYQTFLQGSYKNDTSIPDMNDVDIVAVRKTTYSGIYSPQPQTPRPHIAWDTIFAEIESIILNSTYRNRLIPRGDKCIKISGTLKADIIPAVMHEHHDYDPVIVYSFRDGTERPNYPRTHYENGVSKHARTNEMYKPTVRLFKKWTRNHFDDDKIAPSFYVECAVHSVADDQFTSDPAVNFVLVGADIAQKLWDNTPVMSVSGHKNILNEWTIANRNMFRTQLLESLGHALQALRETTIAGATRSWNTAFNV